MKKGLLALMVVAMVAMAVPAGALAPTIDPLPAVIIGSAGDTADSGGTTLHLFRYNNILDISATSRITWNNADLGFGPEQMHAYYMMESAISPIKASTSQRLVSQISAGEIALIQSDGTRPSAAKEITDDAGNGGVADFWFLSLVNNASGATDSYSATAAANGSSAAAYNFDPEVLTLVLVDGDFPTTALAQAETTIYTVADAEDGWSPAALEVLNLNFANNQNNWWYNPNLPGGAQTLAASSVGDLGLTMNGVASSNVVYGAWVSSTNGTAAQAVVDVDAAAQAGLVFRGTFTLAGSAATQDTTPGYRVMASSEGLTHLAGLAVFAVEGFFGPSQAGNTDAIVYWQTPTTLTEYGDAGALAGGIQTGVDFRDYILEFDLIDFVPADTGQIGLLNCLVELVAEPEVVSNVITWGSGNTAFDGDLQVSGWVNSASDGGLAGVTVGTANITANSITMTAGTSSFGYKAIGMFGTASALPAWTSDQLVRVQSQWATSVTNATPTWRMLTLPVNSTGATGAVTWFDVYDNIAIKPLYTPGTIAAAPAAGGSTLNSFIYTHTALAGGKLSPNIDCYNIGASNGWPSATATLTLSAYGYDVVAP